MVSLIAPDCATWPLPLQEKLVTPAGSGSLTATLVAVLGPVLVTTMVYVVVWPATTVLTPSVLVTPTFTWGVSVSVSVAVSLELKTSPAAMTVTVLDSVPVALGLIAAITVYVTLAPVARLVMVSLIAP